MTLGSRNETARTSCRVSIAGELALKVPTPSGPSRQACVAPRAIVAVDRPLADLHKKEQERGSWGNEGEGEKDCGGGEVAPLMG